MDASLYTRPTKPRTMTVKKRRGAPEVALPLPLPEIITVDTFTECHVTPPNVGKDMVDYLNDIRETGLTAEPQAGTGNLVQALFDAGLAACDLIAVERHVGLCHSIEKRFIDESFKPVNDCFLEYAAREKGNILIPRIIMNPPFKNIKKHMSAALDLLGSDDGETAVLVALVPITFNHPDAEMMEELPRETFSTVSISTKIIRIYR